MSAENSLRIRRLEAVDTDRLVEIWFEASCQAHHFLPLEMLEQQRDLIRKVYLPRAETWVAVCKGKPAGFVSLLDCHIGGLFIDPAMQGSGIGRRLVDHASRDRSPLTVEVYEENAPALAFYKHLDFVAVGRRPLDDNGLPHPLIRMKRG